MRRSQLYGVTVFPLVLTHHTLTASYLIVLGEQSPVLVFPLRPFLCQGRIDVNIDRDEVAGMK